MIRRVLTLAAGVGIAYVVVRQVRKRFGDNDADDFWDDFDEGEPVDPTPGRSAEPPMQAASAQPSMQQAPTPPTPPERPLAVVGESGGTHSSAQHGSPAADAAVPGTPDSMPRPLTPDDAGRFTEGVAEAEGMIKGNIRHDGERIYHMPGDPAYDRVNPEQRFATADEAESAGFRRAGRAHG